MLVVLKFGGTSVASVSRIQRVAKVISEKHIGKGERVVIVVSAMAGITDQLSSHLAQIQANANTSESDVVLSSGEPITTALLAIALAELGHSARSFLGWQVPIITDDCPRNARISRVETRTLLEHIDQRIIPVVAGFQGVTEANRVTTLGRGGSDTTAVALAAALGADRCDIYTDVDGVYSADPRAVPDARRLDRISYGEMLALSAHGAKVLQARSVELAMRYGVRVRVLSSFAESAGTVIEGRAVCSDLRGHSDFSGASADLCGRSNLSTSAASVNNTTPAPLPSGHPRTNITSNRGIPMEKLIVTGITSKHNIVKVDVVIKRADAIRDVLRDVSNAGIRLEFLSQSEFVCDKSLEKCAMFTFITEAQYADVLHGATFSDDVLDVTLTRDVAEVSVIGLGFDEHTLLAVLNACAEHNIQLTLLTASNQIISFITAMQNVDVAILSIHSAFFADTEVQ